jgi:tRNA G46 methylase TrmB
LENQPRTFKLDRVPNPPFRRLGNFERFEAATEIDLEVGGGTGVFALQYARGNPERFLVSVERTVQKFGRFAARLMREGEPENLLACHTDAVSWVSHHLGGRSIGRCFIFYPNPEPKNPNQRWIRAPFFGHLVGRLGAEGEIIFASNLPGYIDEVQELAPALWGLSVSRRSVVAVPARTAFERKYMATGQTCHEIVLSKSNLQ